MRRSLIIFTLIISLVGCTSLPESYTETETQATIYPDYTSVEIPSNIAPLNFMVVDSAADKFRVEVKDANGKSYIFDNRKVMFSTSDWSAILAAGNHYTIDVYTHRDKTWEKHPTVRNTIARTKIDRYLTYRLVEPSYVAWKELGLYERDMTSFDERMIFYSRLTAENQCMNCHTSQAGNSERTTFHLRGKGGGTVINNNGQLEKLELKTDSLVSSGVYSSWNPVMNQIAFSVNDIGQLFHSQSKRKVEVMDFLSDIVIYDVDKRKITPIFQTFNTLETFPTWSHDGQWLYFCTAKAPTNIETNSQARYMELYARHDSIRYDLCRVRWNGTNIEGDVDTVFRASTTGKSVSFPRVSNDGQHLVFTLTNWGNFSIWHPEADLWALDLLSMKAAPLTAANSTQSESYHSFSNTEGGWFVFSSRRDDGSYTRPYLTRLDENGVATKAVMIPQRDPEFYQHLYKSYNLPEFISSPITTSARDLSAVANGPINKLQ